MTEQDLSFACRRSPSDARRALRCFLAALVFATSCAADDIPGTTQVPTATNSPDPARYHIAPQDLIRVTIYGEPEFEIMDRRVDARGEVSLPFIGTIHLAGTPVGQAEQMLRQAYIQGEFFVNPSIAVTVQEYSPKEVMITGEVVNPGVVPFPVETNFMDVMEALGRVGGIKPTGKFDDVRISRRGSDGLTQNFSIDLKRAFGGRKSGEDIFRLLPGDVVYVPDRLL